MEEIWISIKNPSVLRAAGLAAKGSRCQDPQTNSEGTASSKGREPSRIASHRRGTELLPGSGKWPTSTRAKRGLRQIHCSVKSCWSQGSGLWKLSTPTVRMGYVDAYTHIPTGWGMVSAGQGQKRPLLDAVTPAARDLLPTLLTCCKDILKGEVNFW